MASRAMIAAFAAVAVIGAVTVRQMAPVDEDLARYRTVSWYCQTGRGYYATEQDRIVYTPNIRFCAEQSLLYEQLKSRGLLSEPRPLFSPPLIHETPSPHAGHWGS